MGDRKGYVKNGGHSGHKRGEHSGHRRRTSGNRKKAVIVCSVLVAAVVCAGAGVVVWKVLSSRPAASDTVREYFELLEKGDYSGMYSLLSSDVKKQYTEEMFVEKNQNIYEGIEASDIKVTLKEKGDGAGGGVSRKDAETVAYETSMETAAGTLEFDNQMTLVKESGGEYGVQWDPTVISRRLRTGTLCQWKQCRPSAARSMTGTARYLPIRGQYQMSDLCPAR